MSGIMCGTRLGHRRGLKGSLNRRQRAGCGTRQEMTVAEYCDWWRQHSASRHNSSTSNAEAPRIASEGPVVDHEAASPAAASEREGEAAESSGGGGGLWYLKDWHFSTDYPDYKARCSSRD